MLVRIDHSVVKAETTPIGLAIGTWPEGVAEASKLLNGLIRRHSLCRRSARMGTQVIVLCGAPGGVIGTCHSLETSPLESESGCNTALTGPTSSITRYS